MTRILRQIVTLIVLALGIAALVPFAGLPVQPTRIRAIRRRGDTAGASLAKRRAWYGTPMTREQFQALTNLTVALRAVFIDQFQALTGTSLLNTIFRVQDSGRAVERNQGMGGFGNVNEYNGDIEFDAYEMLYRADYTHKEYAKGMAIERKLWDDDEYGVMATRAERLGLAFDRTIEVHAASVFANAFNAANPGPDAVPLCSASHPNSPTDAGVQSNTGVLPLTHDNVITTKQAMRRFKDSRGNVMNVMPDTILVPIEIEDAANVVVDSQARSGTANNDANVNRRYRVVTASYLTDTNNWFLIDSRLARQFLNWFWRIHPEFKEDPTSDFNLVLKFRGYQRYVFGWDHWCWIYGHNVP